MVSSAVSIAEVLSEGNAHGKRVITRDRRGNIHTIYDSPFPPLMFACIIFGL